jgi:hypothetical protein
VSRRLELSALLLFCAGASWRCVDDAPALFIDPNAPLFDPAAPAGGADGQPTFATGGASNVGPAGPTGSGGAAPASNAGEMLPGSLPIGGEPAPATPGAEPAAPEADPTGGARRCPQPAAPLLLDFDVPPNDPAQALFGNFQNTLSGGTYVYPLRSGGAPVEPAASGLVSSVGAGSWRISGTVSEPAGFGLFFDCHQLDASGFIGIAFRISGTFAEPGSIDPGGVVPGPVGPSGAVSDGVDGGAPVVVGGAGGSGAGGSGAGGSAPGEGVTGGGEVALVLGSAANDVARSWFVQNGSNPPGPSFGRCFPASTQFDGTCQGARLTVPFTLEPREVFVPFAELRAGSPEASLNPAELSTVAWQLPVPGGDAGTEPYAVDLVLDDIRFVAP